MKIKDILKTQWRGIGLEFFPPKNAGGKDAFLQVVRELAALAPLYVSMTYGAGGTTQDRSLAALKWISEEKGLTLMSHLTGIGATRKSLGALLEQFRAGGIENILALRGDPPKNAPGFDPAAGDFKYARDLVAFIKETGAFSIAVAVYPEGHLQSPGIEKDMEYTKQKIDAGADFAITQMFFDNRHYYRFLDRAAKLGITIPVVPGIMPIVDCKNIVAFAGVCNASIPQEILDRMEPAMDMPEDMRKLGVEFAVRQVEDLMKHGVNHVHFYTMDRSDSVKEIMHALGMGRQASPAAA